MSRLSSYPTWLPPRLPLDLSSSSCKLSYFNPYPKALTIALLLAYHGYKKGSLSRSGSITAFLIGYFTLANPLPFFGTLMIVFYLTGSKVTKIKSDIKKSLERKWREGETHDSETGGGRNGWQVICNGLVGCVASVGFRLLNSGELSSGCYAEKSSSIISSVFLSKWEQLSTKACLLDPSPTASGMGTSSWAWSRSMILLALAFFSCCCGDVFASELGILSKTSPVLLTRFPPRQVPAGTNGAVSAWGTVASALGGLWMGVVALVLLILVSPGCRSLGLATLSQQSAYLVLFATAAGLAGSGLDSLLGATLQRTWYNTKTKQILVGGKPPSEKSEKGEVEKEWTVITGADVLSNNQVNFISSLATALGFVFLDQFLLAHGLLS